MQLAEFVQRHPPHEPRRLPANDDELRRLHPKDGVRQLESPPVAATVTAVPTRTGDTGCHLWVMDPGGIPYLLERGQVAATFESGMVKHTNLTGGEPASCGGEFWVDPVVDGKLYVNGCSGRYGPRTEAQLADAVAVLRARRYEVVSFGWDTEADKPHMVLRP